MHTPFSAYIEKHAIEAKLTNKEEDGKLDFFVVIPCYNEPEIKDTLEQLCSKTLPPQKKWEILVVINHEEGAEDAIIKQNETSLKRLHAYKGNRKMHPNMTLHTLYLKDIPKRYAGVGFARKTGMDQAILRFQQAQNPDGVIVSLDADTLVADNYCVAIEDAFERGKLKGANIPFEQAFTEDEEINRAVILYELHLRYLIECLKQIPHPCAIHTLGSAFCVTAEAYCKQGGMNRKQGGEDFYFIQKIASLGNYGLVNNTKVYPSSRISTRIPFGTGPAIQQIIKDQNTKQSYPKEAFASLEQFFRLLIQQQEKDPTALYQLFPKDLCEFLPFEQFSKEIAEIKNNSSQSKTYIKRLYQRYNGLFVIKYLNDYQRKNKGGDTDIIELAWQLINETERDPDIKKEAQTLLAILRKRQGKELIL